LEAELTDNLPMERKSPQEKKELSLKKDRRNTYGESPHGARKSIPLRKALGNRANRRFQGAQLPAIPCQIDLDEADKIESAIHSKAPQRWKKIPDTPLGKIIMKKQLRREESRGRKSRTGEVIRKASATPQPLADIRRSASGLAMFPPTGKVLTSQMVKKAGSDPE
jgi:hypothetical protein